MILLDTNVLSEPLRPAPEPAVVEWLDANFPACAMSSVAMFELRIGVAGLPRGRRRSALDGALDRMFRRFGGRIYSFDIAAATSAARLFGTARAAGRGARQLPAAMADLQIAGIAAANGLALATRNIRDFEGYGLDLVNPWEHAA